MCLATSPKLRNSHIFNHIPPFSALFLFTHFVLSPVSLNYDFKHKLLKNSKFFKGLMLGCSVENAYIFTAYTGFDPELGWGTSNTNAGDDFYSYPRPMTITGNLKVTF